MPRAGVPQVAREPGIGEQHSDLLAAYAERFGVWRIEEEEA
jgi:hypothetical protein